jgi:hypothetical protein
MDGLACARQQFELRSNDKQDDMKTAAEYDIYAYFTLPFSEIRTIVGDGEVSLDDDNAKYLPIRAQSTPRNDHQGQAQSEAC